VRAAAPAGAIGLASCCSFDPTKTIAAPGSGGAVLTDDDDLAAHLRRLRWHGRDAGGSHVELGFNSQLPTASAVVLHDKLVHDDPAWMRRRQAIAARYDAALEGTEVRPIGVAPGRTHVFHKYVVRSAGRDAMREHLREHGIPTLVHYAAPLARQPLFHGRCRELPCPVAERACGEVLSLPIHALLTDAEVERVTTALARP
jgi:dTDP-4-amino-4,6-dideoxygalactose transaminase